MGNLEVVKVLLVRCADVKAAVRVVDSDRRTALHLAAFSGKKRSH